MDLRRTFFYELCQGNKTLLLIICGFLSFAAFSAWTKFELTPVYIWSMFAVPLPEQNSYTVTTIYADGRESGSDLAWDYFSDMIPLHTNAAYLSLRDTTNVAPEYRTIRRLGTKLGLNMDRFIARINPGPAELKQYPQWLKQYLAQRAAQPIDSIKVIRYNLAYTDSGRLRLLSIQTLYTE